jgi:hypothetical protein
LSKRTVDTPVFNPNFTFLRIDDVKETFGDAYLTWLVNRGLVLSANLVAETFERDLDDTFVDSPVQVRTRSLPVALRFFGPHGIFGQFTVTDVWQEVERLPTSTAAAGNEHFFLADFLLGIQLPRRMGQIQFEVRNLFDRSFSYYDVSFFSPEPRTPRFVPTQTAVLSVNLRF